MGPISYYFALYKRFQVLGHVPTATYHGQGTGGFNLTNPQAVFGSTNSGSLLGPTASPPDSPLWAVLNSRAMGNPGFTPVDVNGKNWPTMPDGSGSQPPAWAEFQVNAPPPKLVSVLGSWISGGQVNDVPTGVIAQVPAPLKARLDPGTRVFACSMAGDDGVTALPSNFWATSLIFLTDPSSGATVQPQSLAATEQYALTAIVGNRGEIPGGRYASPAGQPVECQAWAMVWNTGMSPAVKLPALSNLDVDSINGTYEIYSLPGGRYEVIGFRMAVQTVFDGLVKAIGDSEVDLGGLTPTQWVHAKDAHLCAKVMVRVAGEGWPSLQDSPTADRRMSQRNLAPFATNLAVETTDPAIEWKNFMVGDTSSVQAFDRRLGTHVLSVESTLPREATIAYLAVPSRIFATLIGDAGLDGFTVLDEPTAAALTPPFPDCVVLRCLGPDNAVRLPALGTGRYVAMSLGVQYLPSKLRPGRIGEVTVRQRTAMPRIDEKRQCYEVGLETVGGCTLRLTAYRSSGPVDTG